MLVPGFVQNIPVSFPSTVWKSDLSDKVKQEFSQSVAVSLLLYGCTTRNKTLREKARWDKTSKTKIVKMLYWFVLNYGIEYLV